MRTITKEELDKILKRHKEWLTDNSKGERANLSFADLRFANLRSANLRFANLSFADLRSADLRSANLRSANLRSANLRFANLSFADLSSADLRSADLRSADLRFADLRGADLLIFQYQRHVAYFTVADGMLRIGCHFMPISEWLIRYEELGRFAEYTHEELSVYGAFIKQCAEIFNGGKT